MILFNASCLDSSQFTNRNGIGGGEWGGNRTVYPGEGDSPRLTRMSPGNPLPQPSRVCRYYLRVLRRAGAAPSPTPPARCSDSKVNALKSLFCCRVFLEFVWFSNFADHDSLVAKLNSPQRSERWCCFSIAFLASSWLQRISNRSQSCPT